MKSVFHILSKLQTVPSSANYWTSFDPDIILAKTRWVIEEFAQVKNKYNEIVRKVEIYELNETLKPLRSSTPANDKITCNMIKNPLFISNSVFVNYIVVYWILEFFLISGKLSYYLRFPNQIKTRISLTIPSHLTFTYCIQNF